MATLETMRQEDLRRWRSEFPEAIPVAALRPRQRQTCVGVAYKIRVVPGRALEVTVEDGTGRLTAIWPGRNNLPGLELGSGLRLTGTVSIDDEGQRRILNPAWSLVAEPYA